MNVVIAEDTPDRLKELIKENNKNWVFYSDSPKDKAELIDRIKGAEAASSYSIKLDEDVFLACPDLKYVAIPAVGASAYIDMESAKRHGVIVMNCPGYNATAVAELAIGLAIDVLRGVSQKVRDVQSGHWDSEKPLGHLISGKRIGLIGYGNVGRTISTMLESWGTTFNFVTSKSSTDEIDELMSTSDIVFVCCPHTPETEKLVSRERLSKMRPSSIIINVSRGPVIDEDALYESLAGGKIAGAGLDVFVNEPGNGQEVPPSIMRFTQLPGVVCTPHTAGTSVESRLELSQMIFDNLESCENGRPINIFEG